MFARGTPPASLRSEVLDVTQYVRNISTAPSTARPTYRRSIQPSLVSTQMGSSGSRPHHAQGYRPRILPLQAVPHTTGAWWGSGAPRLSMRRRSSARNGLTVSLGLLSTAKGQRERVNALIIVMPTVLTSTSAGQKEPRQKTSPRAIDTNSLNSFRAPQRQPWPWY